MFASVLKWIIFISAQLDQHERIQIFTFIIELFNYAVGDMQVKIAVSCRNFGWLKTCETTPLFSRHPPRTSNLLTPTLPCVLPWLYPENHSRDMKPPPLVYLGFFSFFFFLHSCHICVVSWKQAAFGALKGPWPQDPHVLLRVHQVRKGWGGGGGEASVRTCELKVKRGVRFSPYGQRVRGRQRTPKCWWSHWRSLPRTETRCLRCEENSTCALTFSPSCVLVFRRSHLERKKEGGLAAYFLLDSRADPRVSAPPVEQQSPDPPSCCLRYISASPQREK